MRTTTLLLLSLVLLLSGGELFAKSKKKESREPQRRSQRQEQQLRKDLTVHPRTVVNDKDLRRNVKRFGSGVWISGIPMYDQGNRPECAIAVVRRIQDYYTKGTPLDMVALRNALGYRKSFGTNVGTMVKAIQQYSSRLRMRFQQIYELRLSKEDLEDYNRHTRSKKSRGVFDVRNFDWAEFYANLEFVPWQEMLLRNHRQEQRTAWKQITRYIDQGIPVPWGVYLGVVKEQHRKQNAGGHLRMIIGYNAAKRVIYYSDSWGRGHEKKEMDWDTAWAITTHIFVLTPMN